MDLTNPQIVMRDREIAQLKEELAKERKRAETRELALDAAVSSSCVLGAELAKERNKLEMAEAVIAGDGALITGLKNELAAAQATIEQMREKSEAAKNACMAASSGCSHIKTHAECNEARQFAHATKINVETALSALNEVLALTPNLDALHEARALECERLAKKSEQGMLLCNELIEEAAAHRARKENSHG